MITSPEEYSQLSYAANDPNLESITDFRIPTDEPVYQINLNTREVTIPEFLSVEQDHNAEVIWFKVDRFYDDYDLFGAACWIQYKNALKEEHIAIVYPKILAESDHNVLYIPWPISRSVAAAAGKVEFSFQFFRTSEDKQRVYYLLNTKPAVGKILHGF